MCGIAGIIGSHQDIRPILKTMTDAIRHRGPDAEGIYLDNGAGLGHRRLSIVDLSPTGSQPMVSNTGNEILTFNGEIFGYQEIKKKIDGYPFRGTSDSEVILALYQKYGTQTAKFLTGQFAFAIWDKEKQSLFCARDRFGEKPFYYAFGTKGEFIFASEIKAILSSGLVIPIINPKMISFYLKHLYVNPKYSIYSNIFVLPPAHSGVLENKKFIISRYWKIPEVNESYSIGDASELFKSKFDLAVKNQLVADVPVGAFLSGGLDSSNIVASASRVNPNITTISFGFGEQINELPFAKEIANKYKTNHFEEQIDFNDLDRLMIEMVNVYDEPFADSSNIPTYLISKLASQHLKVVLTGDGGDEMLGGYGCYKNEYSMTYKKDYTFSQLAKLFKFSEKVSSKLGFNFLANNFHLLYAKSKYKNLIDYHSKEVHNYFNVKELNNFGIDDSDDFEYSFDLKNDLNLPMRMDIENYMCGDILVKTDRASMANSIELRSPFLDVDLATFCLQLPYSLKFSDKNDKIILRNALQNRLTERINVRSKQGFGAPVKHWMKLPKVMAICHEILTNSNNGIYNYLDFKSAQKYLFKNNYKTWILLNLGLFFKLKG